MPKAPKPAILSQPARPAAPASEPFPDGPPSAHGAPNVVDLSEIRLRGGDVLPWYGKSLTVLRTRRLGDPVNADAPCFHLQLRTQPVPHIYVQADKMSRPGAACISLDNLIWVPL